MQISTAASNGSIHILQQEDGTLYLARTRQTHYLICIRPIPCLLYLFSWYYLFPVHTHCLKEISVLPEGTEAGLKGVKSSDGVWRASMGSRLLAGDAGVCGRGKTIAD